ncbi:hypothetical protein D3C71_1590200 [compost metagenome]
MLKNGVEPDQTQEQDDFDSEMSEDEFEEMIQREAKDIKDGNEAEETSGGWDDI